MTSAECPNGTARCAEAAAKLPKSYDMVVNVQGDEPLIEPEVIDAVVQTLRDAPAAVRPPPLPPCCVRAARGGAGLRAAAGAGGAATTNGGVS